MTSQSYVVGWEAFVKKYIRYNRIQRGFYEIKAITICLLKTEVTIISSITWY